MSDIFHILSTYSLSLKIFSAVSFILISIFIVDKILRAFLKRAQKTRNIWDDAFFRSALKPARFLIIIWGVGYVVNLMGKGLEFLQAFNRIDDVLIVFVLLLFLLRLIKRLEMAYIELHQLNQEKVTTIYAITKILRLSTIITIVLILMQTLGINISGVLAFGGVSGLAVGFAAKDLLSNFFGAIMIYLDKPFKIGDWIRSPDKDIEGVVESIGWRQTRIRTFQKRPIYVPNASFSTITVENASRMSHRRIYENIGVRYDDTKVVEKIVGEIEKYLQERKEVDKNQSLIVNFNKFADSALEIMVYCLVFETNWIKFHALKQEILLDIANIIEKNKADIAYPTMRLQTEGLTS